jgi:uncharacterized protein
MDRQARPPKDSQAAAPAPVSATLVLDTNAVLDWLVFGEPAFDDMAARLAADQARWLSCPALRIELVHVLARASLAHYRPDGERTLSQHDQWARHCEDPSCPIVPRLRCRDADDQVFLELALREQAGWLLTRDRDLLCLARKARPMGLKIVTPEAWRTAADGPPTAPAPQAA